MCDYEATLLMLEKDINVIETALKRLKSFSKILREEMILSPNSTKILEKSDSETDSEPEVSRAPESFRTNKRVRFKEPRKRLGSDQRKYDPCLYSSNGIYSRKEG